MKVSVLLFLFFLPPFKGGQGRGLSAQVLYEVSGNSSKAKSYILATHRLVDIAFLDTIPNVFTCFAKCDKVITEFAMEDYEALAALRQAAVLPDSVRLTNFYSEAEYEHIDQALLLRHQLEESLHRPRLVVSKPLLEERGAEHLREVSGLHAA